MLGLSLVVGWYLTLGLAERDGLPKETMANCYVVTALSAVVMSRVLYFVTNPTSSSRSGRSSRCGAAGSSLTAAFFGGFLGSFVYFRRQKLPLMPWADVAVPSLAAGLMLTRIGCYLFGCDFGKPLPRDAPEWLQKLGTSRTGRRARSRTAPARRLGCSTCSTICSTPTRPASLARAPDADLRVARRRSPPRASLLGAQESEVPRAGLSRFTFTYGVLRFLLEMIRDDLERGEYGPHMAEHVLVAGGLFLFAVAYSVCLAPSVADPTLRRLTQVVAFVPPSLPIWLLQAGVLR